MGAGDTAAQVWSAEQVRRVVAEHLRINRPSLVRDMTREITTKIPEYARPGDESYRTTVERGVDHALQRFLDVLDGRDGAASGWRELYRQIGAGEVREGRSLDAVHSALRMCTRIGWQRLIQDADHEDIPLRELGPMAGMIFAYLDEIADASAEGYAHAKAAEVGESERRRRRLVTLLTTTPPVSAEAVTAAAVAARWELPAELAVVVLDGSAALSIPPPLPPGVLADFDRAEPCLIVPDPDRDRQLGGLVGLLAGYRAVVGPSVPYPEAATSLRRASTALDLVRRGIIPGTGTPGTATMGTGTTGTGTTGTGTTGTGTTGTGTTGTGVVFSQDHLSTMALFQDEELLDVLIARRLAPLNGRPPRQRAILAETLLAWLQANGNANLVAAMLHIHPQTARHRLRQIIQLFGAVLDDTNARFELQIALRAERARREKPAT